MTVSVRPEADVLSATKFSKADALTTAAQLRAANPMITLP